MVVTHTIKKWVWAALVLSVVGLIKPQARIIATYDATRQFSPPDPATILDPTDPMAGAWNPVDPTLGPTDIQTGIVVNTRAYWRNHDGTDGNKPGYSITLSSADMQDMYDFGWKMTAIFRCYSGAHRVGWGVPGGGNPWGISTPEDAGITFQDALGTGRVNIDGVDFGSSGPLPFQCSMQRVISPFE